MYYKNERYVNTLTFTFLPLPLDQKLRDEVPEKAKAFKSGREFDVVLTGRNKC